MPDHGRSTGARQRRRSIFCRTCGIATPGRGRPGAGAVIKKEVRERRPRRIPKLGRGIGTCAAADGQAVELLFTENETNFKRIDNAPKHIALCEGWHPRCCRRREPAGREWQTGQQNGGPCEGNRAGRRQVYRRRSFSTAVAGEPFADFDVVLADRVAEADTFHKALQPAASAADARLVARQAFAGLLWSKQYYHYDVYRWLKGDPTEPTPPDSRWKGRNSTWKELHNADVILMPDTWEYPWYASWDLAFHCIAISHIDPAFAKEQLLMMGYEWYQHANGQFPAYEWNFDDANPPVQCWAAWRVYQIEFEKTGVRDSLFLKRMFQNGMLNFSYWVNRKDRGGRDVFGGGFLGMDNIGCVDRDQPLADGGQLEQSDGTSWMALYCNHHAQHRGRTFGERAVLSEHGE